ncbi:MAG: COG1615 family transporter [Richelia sp. RM2_1_2]|nr:COG1615 family transporter [Richelia sp. RM1_1_1]NJO28919.1 COG1615 family transporter [Richelia sp. SL_2_1]NJO60921.1 COG1615 family transporter [Richelia sp. RM2_1_2]
MQIANFIFQKSYRIILLLLGFWLMFDLASHLVAELIWFDKVEYLSEFILRLITQLGLWAIAFFTSGCFLLGNLIIARKFQHPKQPYENQEIINKQKGNFFNSPNFRKTPSSSLYSYGLKLRWLLPTIFGLSVLVGTIVVFYSQQVLNIWYPQLKLPSELLQFPSWLQLTLNMFGLRQLVISILQFTVVLILTAAIFISYEFWIRALSVFVSSLLGFLISARWINVLEYFQANSFNVSEPLFNRDISFYVFSLPIWELLQFWLLGLFLLGIAAVALIYLRSANSLSEGKFPGFTVQQRMHLNGLGCLVMLAIALRYWLLRYQLLYSKLGVNYGASYTDVNVLLPIYTILSILAIGIAAYLMLRTLTLSKRRKYTLKRTPYPPQLVYVSAFFLVVATVAVSLLPTVVQKLVVQPNEITREKPYIERTIKLTRQAFNLNSIDATTFNPQNNLTASDLQKNDLTIDNIRLWDTRPLLQSNRQLQQIRPYYKFPDADIDRYTLKRSLNSQASFKQQTIIAARELDYNDVPDAAKTWVNKHLVYTHGYGFTLSPVNQVAPGGLPYYYVKDIGVENSGNQGSLSISNAEIRASIPIGNPRIYYGELTNTYVMTRTKTQEFDYPSGNANEFNVYDGSGGIPIGSPLRRLLFAQYLKDWQMLLTRNFKPETKVLFRRNIRERIRRIAPFLRFDRDPYLVAADGKGTTIDGQPTYLYWIIDAYTTSNHYPYSDPGKNQFNYIRNSVKIVVDAYNGDVNFYIADSTDPIINTLQAIFPSMFKPLSEMPVTLRSHIRYPLDYFSIQSERLLAYHMTDSQVFYNREDLWQIPTETYGTEQQQVQPYYLITKLPTAQNEEFILLLPFTPTQRRNLIAWLAARSDGSQYGRLLLYEFPKQELVYGPQQIEALINQNPEISQQITLWNREGSRVIQGNLLVIPIEQSLLYVEPLYLEAEENSLPTLVRVIVAYDNQIVMEETLEEALGAIFDVTEIKTPVFTPEAIPQLPVPE